MHSLRFTEGFFPPQSPLVVFYNRVYHSIKQYTDITSHSKFTNSCCHHRASRRSVTVAWQHFESTTKQETCRSSKTQCGKQASPFDAAPFASYFCVIKMSLFFLFFKPCHISPKKIFEKTATKKETKVLKQYWICIMDVKLQWGFTFTKANLEILNGLL